MAFPGRVSVSVLVNDLTLDRDVARAALSAVLEEAGLVLVSEV